MMGSRLQQKGIRVPPNNTPKQVANKHGKTLIEMCKIMAGEEYQFFPFPITR
jgi:hypothetical protein